MRRKYDLVLRETDEEMLSFFVRDNETGREEFVYEVSEVYVTDEFGQETTWHEAFRDFGENLLDAMIAIKKG